MFLIGIDPAVRNCGVTWLNTDTGAVEMMLIDWAVESKVDEIDNAKVAIPWLQHFYIPLRAWLEAASHIFIEKPYITGRGTSDISIKLMIFVNLLTAIYPNKIHLVDPKKVLKYFDLGMPPPAKTKAKTAKTKTKAKAPTADERYKAKKMMAVKRACEILYVSGAHYAFANQSSHQTLLNHFKRDDLADAILIVYYGWACVVHPKPVALESLANSRQYDTWMFNLYMDTAGGRIIKEAGFTSVSQLLNGLSLSPPRS